jgi:HEAT repeat protein
VQFRFAARSDVCGLGQAFQVGRSYFVNNGPGLGEGWDRVCRRGPVVVRVTRAGGQVVGVETEIAPETTSDGVNDIGAVSAAAAAEYLLDLAVRADGRPGREAILPAVLADSASVWPGLLAIGKNRDVSRSVRQGALSWLGRELDRISVEEGRRASTALVAIATDPEETLSIRQQAVSVLARNQRADLTALTRMATGPDSWLRDAAVQAMANSGDPRAREFLRTTLGDPNLPEKLRVTVVRGIGNQYATAKDIELLRSRYAGLTSLEAKRAILNAVGEQGGTANLQWLIGVAADPNTVSELRGQAAESAQRAGATSTQLSKLYDDSPDRRGKEAAINGLFKNGDRAAVDALIRIARSETDPSVRRSLINRLGRLDDERVKTLLKELTEAR